MPLDNTSRNTTAGGASPYIPLITNNPAFQVEIVPMDGKLEQKPNQKNGAQDATQIGVGDTIKGDVAQGTGDKKVTVMGRVVAIENNEGTITGYKVLDQKGKEVIVDPSTAIKIQVNGEDPVPSAQQVQLENYSPENKILLYEQWKQMKDK